MGAKDRRSFTVEEKTEILEQIDAYEAEGIVFAEACREVGVVNSVVRRWQASRDKGLLAGSTDRATASSKRRAKKRGRVKHSIPSGTAKIEDEVKMGYVEEWVRLQEAGNSPEEAAGIVGKHSTSLYKWRKELEVAGLREPRTRNVDGRALPTEKKSPAAYAAGKKTPLQLLKVDGMCPNCGQAISL